MQKSNFNYFVFLCKTKKVKHQLTITVLIITFIFSKSLAQTSRSPIPQMDNKMLKEFIQMHLVYPEKDLNTKTQGILEITFATDDKGKLTSQEIISSISEEIDAEGIRLFKLIIWQPALKYGIPIAGTDVFKINFSIKKYKKAVKRRRYNTIELNYPIDTSNLIYNENNIDIQSKPKLPEGCTNLYTYVYKQMNYPQQAAELEIEGKVELCFIIETNGLPSNLIVNKTVGGGCTNEAIRIINELKWQAGFKNDIAVRSKKTMFIDFKLSNKSGKHIPNQTNSGF